MRYRSLEIEKNTEKLEVVYVEKQIRARTGMNMVGSRQSIPWWISGAATRVDFEGNASSAEQQNHHPKPISDSNLNFADRTFSAAGAAFFSAIVLNPLDIAKVIFISRLL